MARNRLIWTVTAIGTTLILFAQYCIRVSLESISPLEPIPLFSGILYLTYSRAEDAAFSIFADAKQLLTLIRIGSILFITFVIFFISWILSKSGKEMMKALQIGVGLLLAGAISNTVEKIVFNENAVFIGIRSTQIPALNFADISIHLGQAISAISLILLGIQFAVKRWRL